MKVRYLLLHLDKKFKIKNGISRYDLENAIEIESDSKVKGIIVNNFASDKRGLPSSLALKIEEYLEDVKVRIESPDGSYDCEFVKDEETDIWVIESYEYRSKLGFANSGLSKIKIYDKKMNCLNTENVLFLPTDISYTSLIEIINDLNQINYSLFENENDTTVSFVQKKIVDSEYIIELCTRLKSKIDSIEKKPATDIAMRVIKGPINGSSRFDPTIEIRKNIEPYIKSFKQKELYSDVNIYEHRVIKKLLKSIKSFSLNKKYSLELEIDEIKNTVNNLKDSMNNLTKFNEKLKDSIERQIKKNEDNKVCIFEIRDRYCDAIKTLDELLNKNLFKNIENYSKETIKPTQLFNLEPKYNLVWKDLNEFYGKYETMILEDDYDRIICSGKISDIYEKWVFVKIIYILVNKMGWKMTNIDESKMVLNKMINDILERISVEDDNQRAIELELGDWYLEIKYNSEVHFAKNESLKRPDYLIVVSKMNNGSRVYEGAIVLDAKTQNMKLKVDMDSADKSKESKGWSNFYKQIWEVSMERRYANAINDEAVYGKSRLENLGVFIVHPNLEKNLKYSNNNMKFESYNAFFDSLFLNEFKRRSGKEMDIAKTYSNRFGGFPLTPSYTSGFKKMFLMIMEHKIGIKDICWSCGNLDPEKRTLQTVTGKDKFHYECECGEFWVDNYCFRNHDHKLTKHAETYHKMDGKKDPFYVVCPKCNESYE